VDRRDPERPQVRVVWPGIPFGLCPCPEAAPISLDLVDGDLQDVFRIVADSTRLNVVVHPGTGGKVTYRARQVPWAEALERMLAPSGFVARLEGNFVEIGRPEALGERRAFTGAPISFDYQGKELVETVREVAAHGRATVEVPDGVMGRVTLKLDEVPWDQAFDVLARVNGLTWARTGGVIHLQVRRPGPAAIAE
jgi:type II secretory pathway component HofQ